MSWIVSFILASSLFSAGNMPVREPGFAAHRILHGVQTADETENFSQTYPLNPNGRISVSNVNGSITIDTWDRNQIKLDFTKTADSRETLDEVEVKINATADRFEVETDFGNWNRRGKQKWDNYRRKIEVQYRLTVPQSAVLDEIETVNGSVTLKDLGNYVKASAVNGAVSGMNLRGTAELSTVNGAVTADFDQLQTGSVIALSTVNGSANLVIPSDANATLRAETVNGSIVNDFGLPVRKGKYVGRDLYGVIGTGDVKIKLESVNGGLSIKRKKDGKAPNPVTHKLPPKSADDYGDFGNDFDGDFEESLTEARQLMEKNLSVARLVMEQVVTNSSRDAIEAVRANKEMTPEMAAEFAKIAPDIARIDVDALRAAAEALDQAGKKLVVPVTPKVKIAPRLADTTSFNAPYLEDRAGSYAVKGRPLVRIDSHNCPISVIGSDNPEVRYSMSRVASMGYYIPIEFKASKIDDSTVEIKLVNKNEWTVSGFDKSKLPQVRLEVFVPKKSDLKIVSNDEVRLEGVSGDIDLQGRNGAINIRDTDGKLNLRSEDALVRVIGFKGEFQSQTADGEMFLEGDFQKISSQLKDGVIVLTLPERTDANVTANTGSVAGDGINLIRQNNGSAGAGNHWRIGKGGRDFNFQLAEGKVIFRSLSDLRTS